MSISFDSSEAKLMSGYTFFPQLDFVRLILLWLRVAHSGYPLVESAVLTTAISDRAAMTDRDLSGFTGAFPPIFPIWYPVLYAVNGQNLSSVPVLLSAPFSVIEFD